MTFKRRVCLKDIRVSWVDGELRKDGNRKTEDQVCNSLQNKHKQFGNEEELTEQELHDIIYKDRSLYRQRPSKLTKAQIELKRLESELKVRDLQKLRLEYKKEAISTSKEAAATQKMARDLMENSKPGDFGVDMYQRMNPQYVILAIQSMYPDFSIQQCRLIIGSWVRRGL